MSNEHSELLSLVIIIIISISLVILIFINKKRTHNSNLLSTKKLHESML